MENFTHPNNSAEFFTHESIHAEREHEKTKSIDKRNRRLGGDALKEVVEDIEAKQQFSQVEFQLSRAEKRISRYKEDYYIAGAEKNLEAGHLEVFNPNNIITGFQAIDGREFGKVFESERDKLLFDSALGRKIANKITRFEDRENLLALEHEAAMNAIAEGAYVEHNNPSEPVFNLPMNDANLREALEARGIDFADRETRINSINGFINIIETTKHRQDKFPTNDTIIGQHYSVADLSGDRFKEANWYFDNFNYGQNKDTMDEFIGKINEYAETADEAWSDAAKDFLSTRPEYAEYLKETETPSRRDSVLNVISNAKEISWSDFTATLRELGLEQESANVFPESGEGPKRRRKHPSRVPRNLVPGAIKRKVFLNNIKQILDLRNDANLYCSNIKNGNRIECYGVIRFGYKDHNVVIAESLTDAIGACYVWCGKTGDNREGWREPFSASKTHAREQDFIRVFNHDQRKALDSQQVTATTKTEAMWGRIWDYLNSLPA